MVHLPLITTSLQQAGWRHSTCLVPLLREWEGGLYLPSHKEPRESKGVFMQTLSVIEDSMLSLYLHNVHSGVNVTSETVNTPWAQKNNFFKHIWFRLSSSLSLSGFFLLFLEKFHSKVKRRGRIIWLLTLSSLCLVFFSVSQKCFLFSFSG